MGDIMAARRRRRIGLWGRITCRQQQGTILRPCYRVALASSLGRPRSLLHSVADSGEDNGTGYLAVLQTQAAVAGNVLLNGYFSSKHRMQSGLLKYMARLRVDGWHWSEEASHCIGFFS